MDIDHVRQYEEASDGGEEVATGPHHVAPLDAAAGIVGKLLGGPGHGGADQNLEMAGKAADLHAVCSTGGASPHRRALAAITL